jgi:hypothetical protein
MSDGEDLEAPDADAILQASDGRQIGGNLPELVLVPAVLASRAQRQSTTSWGMHVSWTESCK